MDWYDPGEDSYTLLDVLVSENIQNKVIIDLGCSTGIITDLLDSKNIVLSIDLNVKALKQLKNKNGIRTDLLKGINQDMVDICIFNPPYVPDFDCPILGGGEYGRLVIDRFLKEIETRTFYLLVIEANKPIEIVEIIKKRGYKVEVLKIRRVIGETIIVLKAVKTV